MNKVLVLNGPNLNMLGIREPAVYGRMSLKDIETAMTEIAGTLDLQLTFHQSNHEGQLIDWIHEAHGTMDGF